MTRATDSRLDTWRQRAFVVWTVIGWTVLAIGVMLLLGRIWSALVPFVLAAIVVFICRAPVTALQQRGVPRLWGTAICFGGGFLLIGVASAFILPSVGRQTAAFVSRFPEYLSAALSWWRSVESSYQGLSLPRWTFEAVDQLQMELASAAPVVSSAIARGAAAVGTQAMTLLFDLVIALVIAFWMLKDLPTIRDEILVLAGERRDDVAHVLREISEVLGGYLKAQIIISTVTGTVVAVGLGVIGVPYALVLGIITGALNIVPYLGPAIASIVAAIVAGVATQNMWLVLASLGIIFATQQVVDLLITPRVMSDQVDLHPVLVLLSLLAGGTLFGAPGMLLAIPVAAVGKAVFVYFYEKSTSVELGTHDGALFKAPKPAAETCDEPDEPENG